MTAKHASKTLTRGTTVAVATVAFALVSGTAMAYWTTGGDGTGTATAGTAARLVTVSATTAPGVLLYPGGPDADLRLRVSNPNPFPVSVTSVAAGAGPVTATGGTGECTTTGVSYVAGQLGLPFTVPPGSAAETVLKAAVRMSAASETGCQGATFVVPVTFDATGQ